MCAPADLSCARPSRNPAPRSALRHRRSRQKIGSFKEFEELRVLGAFVVAVLRFSLRKSPEVADDNGKGEALAHDKDFLVGATAAEAG